MPDKVLEEFVCVFLLEDEASGLDDVAGVVDKALAVLGELCGVYGRVCEGVGEGTIALVVCGQAGLAECGDDAVEAEFAVDVGGLSGFVDGFDNGVLWVGE